MASSSTPLAPTRATSAASSPRAEDARPDSLDSPLIVLHSAPPAPTAVSPPSPLRRAPHGRRRPRPRSGTARLSGVRQSGPLLTSSAFDLGLASAVTAAMICFALKVLPGAMDALWAVVMLRSPHNEEELAADNVPPDQGESCGRCGKPWYLHAGKGECPWWQTVHPADVTTNPLLTGA